MIFTGYTLYYYLMNKLDKSGKDYIPKESCLHFVQENNDIQSKNYTFTVSKQVDIETKYLYFIKQPRNFNSSNIYAIYIESKFYDIFYSANKDILTEKLHYDSLKNILIFTYQKRKDIPLGDYFKFYKPDGLALIPIITKSLLQIHSFNHKQVLDSYGFTEIEFKSLSIPILFLENLIILRSLKDKIPIKPIHIDDASIKKFEEIQNVLKSTLDLENNTIIHNDLRWDNFLFTENNGFKIIDWEMALIGDKYIDLADLLLVFLDANDSKVDEYINYKKELIASIWKNYHTSVSNSDEAIEKIIRIIGLRKLESMLERFLNADFEQFRIEDFMYALITTPKEVKYQGVYIFQTLKDSYP